MQSKPTIKANPKGYALFDLDQTLAPWDMQLLFANWVFHWHPARRLYLIFFLATVPFAQFLGARRMKRLFLAILYGLSQEEVTSLCKQFSEHYCPQIFYPEILTLLKEQQDADHLCILTSASPYLYVQHIGKKLGFDHTFGTEVTEPNHYPLFPEIHTNNKSVVKTERLRTWLNSQGIKDQFPLPKSTAFTDSSADLPLVEIAEQAVLVHPSKSLEQTVRDDLKKPYRVLKPKRPFNTNLGHLGSSIQKLFGLYPI